MTLDRLLRNLDHADRVAMDPTTVVVLDEASMVGTRKLTRLLEHAERAGAKVVLVGDHYQLPEIDAGGAFAGLAARLHAPQLVENAAKIQPWERGALAELRAGDANMAFAAYQAHQRVHHDEDSERLRDQLVEDWWTAQTRGHASVMLAGRNSDVDDLNQRARDRLANAGTIGPDRLDVEGHRFAVGDAIMTTRNDYRLGVLNGTHATITQIDTTTGTIHAQSGADDLVLPWRYVAAGRVTHAYAMTFHKAQGMTVHSAFVLADDTLDRPRAYTGLSRGTHQNALYITGPPDERADERHAPEAANNAVAHARESMARMLGKSMATDTREPAIEPERPARAAQRLPEPPGLGPDLGP